MCVRACMCGVCMWCVVCACVHACVCGVRVHVCANATKECLCGCRQWKDDLLLMLLRNVCVVAGSGRMTYC